MNSRSFKSWVSLWLAPALLVAVLPFIQGCPFPSSGKFLDVFGRSACYTWFGKDHLLSETKQTTEAMRPRFVTPISLMNNSDWPLNWKLNGPLPRGFFLDPPYGEIGAGEIAQPVLWTERRLGRGELPSFYTEILFEDFLDTEIDGDHDFKFKTVTSDEVRRVGNRLFIPVMGERRSKSLLESVGFIGDQLTALTAPLEKDGYGFYDDVPFSENILRFVRPERVGKLIPLSFLGAPRTLPTPDVEINASLSYLLEDFDYSAAFGTGGLFPAGTNSFGAFTILPNFDNGPPADTNFWFVGAALDDDILISAPNREAHYAALFETDGRPENDYTPPTNIPGDTFKITDKWFFARKALDDTWEFVAAEVQDDNTVQEVFSSARAVIYQNYAGFVIPESELNRNGSTADDPKFYRTASFTGPVDVFTNPEQASKDFSGDGLDVLIRVTPSILRPQF